MKKICIITSSRADFGLLKNLIIKMQSTKRFDVKLIVGGSHFSKEHGFSFNEILSSGIKIYKKIKFRSYSDSLINISKIFSRTLTETTKILKKINPDLLLVLGDRYEILSSVIAAQLVRIPVGHIHGGEITLGAIDDAFRHSITKMSHIHFCANETYKKRIVQLGENPKNIYVVGGLGVDSIKNTKFLTRNELEKKFNLKFLKRNFLVCLHPETVNKNFTKKQIKTLLSALSIIKNKCLIFTSPGADNENVLITKEIKKFVKETKNAYFFKSLGQQNYYSFLNQVDGLIGNSSSGVIEMPYFFKGTVNLGIRQLGRTNSSTIVNTNFIKKKIVLSINKILSKQFRNKITTAKNINLYGKPGASDKIIKILIKKKLKKIFMKDFVDQKQIYY